MTKMTRYELLRLAAKVLKDNHGGKHPIPMWMISGIFVNKLMAQGYSLQDVVEAAPTKIMNEVAEIYGLS